MAYFPESEMMMIKMINYSKLSGVRGIMAILFSDFYCLPFPSNGAMIAQYNDWATG
jgi:hypothetical protein